MSAPAPVVPQPDIEAWVIRNIRSAHGVTAFVVAGGQLYHGWAHEYTVQIDCRAKEKKRARDLAEHVRQVVAGLPDVPWPDGVISYHRCAEGPFWLPDDDGDPRYCQRWVIRCHPRRALAAGDLPTPPGQGDG